MAHIPKCKTQNYKFLEDSIEKNLGDLEFGITFQTQYQKHNIWKKIAITGLHKSKNLFSAKGTIKRMKKQAKD